MLALPHVRWSWPCPSKDLQRRLSSGARRTWWREQPCTIKTIATWYYTFRVCVMRRRARQRQTIVELSVICDLVDLMRRDCTRKMEEPRVLWLLPHWQSMMTSSNGNIFCVTGPLWGEFTGDRWIPLTKASDAELSLICARINSKQSWGWLLRRHRAHYDVMVMRWTIFKLTREIT